MALESQISKQNHVSRISFPRVAYALEIQTSTSKTSGTARQVHNTFQPYSTITLRIQVKQPLQDKYNALQHSFICAHLLLTTLCSFLCIIDNLDKGSEDHEKWPLLFYARDSFISLKNCMHVYSIH